MKVYYRQKDGRLGVYEVDTTDAQIAIVAVVRELKYAKEPYKGAVLALCSNKE